MKNDVDIIKMFYTSFGCNCTGQFSSYLKKNNYICYNQNIIDVKEKRCPLSNICSKFYNGIISRGNYKILNDERKQFCIDTIKTEKMKEILK